MVCVKVFSAPRFENLFTILLSIQESLPPDYARIFAFDNFTRTQKHVLAKALNTEQGDIDDCIPASSYARLHIKEVPTGVASKLCTLANTMPIIACGLLQHESKVSVLHFRYLLFYFLRFLLDSSAVVY